MYVFLVVIWIFFDGVVVYVFIWDVEDMFCFGEFEVKVWKVVGYGVEEGIGIGEIWVGFYFGDGELVYGGEDVGYEYESGVCVNSGGEFMVLLDFFVFCLWS